MTGRFIVVEGPNGVGKTTAASGLGARLTEASGKPVHLTTEPTQTEFGRLLRSSESRLTGRAFALAIAADRYDHVEHEINPALENDIHVISDRYVPSSLVLQRIDGLDLEEIWHYNQHVLVPAVTFYLEDDSAIIQERLEIRGTRSRLELMATPERELALYQDAYDHLRRQGWTQQRVDCRGRTTVDVAAAMLGRLDRLTE